MLDLIVEGKTTILGTHPTRYGYATERDLMTIPNEHMDSRADYYRSQLREDGFTITREIRG